MNSSTNLAIPRISIISRLVPTDYLSPSVILSLSPRPPSRKPPEWDGTNQKERETATHQGASGFANQVTITVIADALTEQVSSPFNESDRPRNGKREKFVSEPKTAMAANERRFWLFADELGFLQTIEATATGSECPVQVAKCDAVNGCEPTFRKERTKAKRITFPHELITTKTLWRESAKIVTTQSERQREKI
jgi:hypothetical protein